MDRHLKIIIDRPVTKYGKILQRLSVTGKFKMTKAVKIRDLPANEYALNGICPGHSSYLQGCEVFSPVPGLPAVTSEKPPQPCFHDRSFDE